MQLFSWILAAVFTWFGATTLCLAGEGPVEMGDRNTDDPPESSRTSEHGTYRNPVIDGTLADPAVIFHQGVYYLYATGEVDGDNGYRVYTSADLVNWRRGPVVFRPGQRHIWAPDIWRDPDSGRFYLYYTANRTVGVAEAAEPVGPFVITRKLVDSAIDAHLFRDEDGRLYLYYVQLPGFRITVQPMANPVELTGEPRVILQPESEWETRNGRVTEGPWIIKHDGRYYLLYSGSGADTPDYAVGYATSSSPLGPFTRAEHNPILHRGEGLYGPGHGCAIQDAEGTWWFVYHQKNSDRRAWDRFICIDRLDFDEHGRLDGQATRNQLRPAPATAREARARNHLGCGHRPASVGTAEVMGDLVLVEPTELRVEFRRQGGEVGGPGVVDRLLDPAGTWD